MSLATLHMLAHLGLTLSEHSIVRRRPRLIVACGPSRPSCLRAHQVTDFLGDFLITFFFSDFPNVLFLVLSFSDQSLLSLFGLNDVVTVIFVCFVRLCAIREDLN